jgi:hypothetical protein
MKRTLLIALFAVSVSVVNAATYRDRVDCYLATRGLPRAAWCLEPDGSVRLCGWPAGVARPADGDLPSAADTDAWIASRDNPQPPQVYPDGIESPVLVLQTADGKGVGVIADGLDLVTYVDHASPRPDAATLAARIAAAKAERAALRDVLRDIRAETATNLLDCADIAASTTNTANAAQGRQLEKLAGELADTNRQLNRLRRALLDYLRGTE